MNLRKASLLLAIALAGICITLLFLPAEPTPVIKLKSETILPIETADELIAAQTLALVDNSAKLLEDETGSSEPKRSASRAVHRIGIQVLDYDHWLAGANLKVYFLTDEIFELRRDELADFNLDSPWGQSDLSLLPSVTTDSDGLAILDLPGRIARLYAKADGMRGTLRIPLLGEPTEEVDYQTVLYLQKTEDYEVEVLSQNRISVANVPVFFQGLPSSRAISGADGTALLGLPVKQIEKVRGKGTLLPFECDLPFLEYPQGSFDVRNSAHRVAIELPPFGGVRIVAPKGMGGRCLFLSLGEPKRNKRGIPIVEMEHGDRGYWRYTFLPLDTKFDILIGSDLSGASSHQTLLTGVAGPTSAGEVVTLHADASQAMFVTAELKDFDGRSIGKSMVQAWVLDQDGAKLGEPMKFTSMADGTIGIYLHPNRYDFDQSKMLWLTLSKNATGFFRPSESEYLCADFEAKMASTISLGKLRPTPRKLLVSGKVIYPDGRPFTNTSVSVVRQLPGMLSRSRNTVSNVFKLDQGKNPQGNFSFSYAEAPFDCEFTLRVDPVGDYRSLAQVIEAGSRDLVVTMEKVQNIEFTFSANKVTDRVSFYLISADGQDFQSLDTFYGEYQRGSPGEVHKGTFFSVIPGIYVFRAETNRGEFLLEIPNFEVVAGKKNPPELQDLILSQNNSIQVEMQFAEGEKRSRRFNLRMNAYERSGEGLKPADCFIQTENGVLIRRLALNSMHMLVVNGFHPIELDGLQDGDVITLSPLPTAIVYLDESALTQRYTSAHVQFVPREEWDPELQIQMANVDLEPIAKGKFQISFPKEGYYRTKWTVYSEIVYNESEVFYGPEVFLTEVPPNHEFTLKVPPQVISKVQELAAKEDDE
ncbi:MAG: hypothetical protein HQ519_02955 [Planctomycetes bacterium]|nr:hypothetical protein [Planctomycetota bacterium]